MQTVLRVPGPTGPTRSPDLVIYRLSGEAWLPRHRHAGRQIRLLSRVGFITGPRPIFGNGARGETLSCAQVCKMMFHRTWLGQTAARVNRLEAFDNRVVARRARRPAAGFLSAHIATDPICPSSPRPSRSQLGSRLSVESRGSPVDLLSLRHRPTWRAAPSGYSVAWALCLSVAADGVFSDPC